jgi:pimeloyl-ACP methyl ester carboxylesterase
MVPGICDTAKLHVAYLDGGAKDGHPALLLHGWPDDPTSFGRMAPALHAAGYRTLAPWLRGFGATKFVSEKTKRSGQIAAMAQDAIAFADACGMTRFTVIGHDWGARIAYMLATLFPERIEACVAMSVGWSPGAPETPPLPQIRAFWYQWFMATERGADFVHAHGRDLARFLWEDWSPPGWFGEAEFAATAESFANPDWAAITVHSYRVRWGEAKPDPDYDELEKRYSAVDRIAVPTLMLQGAEDRVVLPSSSEGKDGNFTGRYERALIPGAGHFLAREAPDAVSKAILDFLRA